MRKNVFYGIIILNMTDNLFFSSLKFVFKDLIWDIIYFPIWWYSLGLKKVVLFCFKEIVETSHRLAIGILFSHLLKPMYGQYDLAGRIISFVFRILQFLWHLLFVFIWIILIFAVLIFWIALPIITVWQIFLIFNYG
jgi:hypothetical protein